MGIIAITVYKDVCEDGCELIPIINWLTFGIIFVPILIGIWGVCYIYRKKKHKRRTVQTDGCIVRCEDTVRNSPNTIEIYFPFIVHIIPRKQVKIRGNVCLFTTRKFHTASIANVDIYTVPIGEINKTVDQVFPLFEERKLICYCDGSYSHSMKIGYSGFLSSDGVYQVSFLCPRDPKCGSTDAEVLAVYLAIQYALKEHYNTLIIYTDNSKVEQLLKRPKKKDHRNYPEICQILSQYQEQQGNHTIQVVRVRGHTSRDEQEKCQIKYEFAKIDRIVRRKTRRYRKRWWVNFKKMYYYDWYKPVHYIYYTGTILQYHI